VTVLGRLFLQHRFGELQGEGWGLGGEEKGVGAVASHVFPVEPPPSGEQVPQVGFGPVLGHVAPAVLRQKRGAESIPQALQTRIGRQRRKPRLLACLVHRGEHRLARLGKGVQGLGAKRENQERVVAFGATMIRFGTAGWRGVVGEDFTFRRVRLLIAGIAQLLRQRGDGGPILVAYDTRLLSARLASEAVDVLTHHGFPTVLADRDLPAPALAWAVREKRAAVGVMFTASHNNPDYNGVKLYTSGGVLAGRTFTDPLEAVVGELEQQPEGFFVRQPKLAQVEPLGEGYLQALEQHVDWEALGKLAGKVVVDPLFGTAREFLDRVLLAHGVPLRVLHATKDPYFGGYAPECAPRNLVPLQEAVREERAVLGLATDGDADRFGVVDRNSRVVPPNLVLATLVDYLLGKTQRGAGGGVGRTVATTRLVDRIARAHGVPLVETPVGFPNLGPLLASGEVAVAVEESAGLGVASHLPERDGIFACLLVAEMLGGRGETLEVLVRRTLARYGPLFSRRVDLPRREESAAALAQLQAREYRSFAGREVRRASREGGLLLELAGDCWVLWRLAGTEPKVRLYGEAPGTAALRQLLREAKRAFREAEEEVRHVHDR